MFLKRVEVKEIEMFLIILEEIDFLVATLQLETFVFLCALCRFCAFCFVALLRIPNEFDLWHAIRIKLNNSNKWFFLFSFIFVIRLLLISQVESLFVFCFLQSCVDTIATVVKYDRASVRAHVQFLCHSIYFQTFRFAIENFASLFFSQLSVLLI